MGLRIMCDNGRSTPSGTSCGHEATEFTVHGAPAFAPPVLLSRCSDHSWELTDGALRVSYNEAVAFQIMTS